MATITKFPTANSGGTYAFSQPTYAYSDNSSWAEVFYPWNVTGRDYIQFYSTFGFGVPAGATITAITITAEYTAYNADGESIDFGLAAYLGTTTLRGSESVVSLSNSVADQILTASTTGSWTVDELNTNSASGLNVRMRLRKTSDLGYGFTFDVDYVKVEITYTTSTNKTITAVVAAATAAAIAPTISTQRNKTITAVVGVSTAAAVAPTISTQQNKTVSAVIAAATASMTRPYTNLVSNNDFSNGTTGWTYLTSVVNGRASKLATAQWGNFHQRVTVVAGHKYYFRADVEGDAGVYWGNIANGTYITVAGAQSVSKIYTPSGTYLDIGMGDSRTSGWTTFYMDNVLLTDLTDIELALGTKDLAWCNANLPFVTTTGYTDLPVITTQRYATVAAIIADATADAIAPTVSAIKNPSIAAVSAEATADGISPTIALLNAPTLSAVQIEQLIRLSWA